LNGIVLRNKVPEVLTRTVFRRNKGSGRHVDEWSREGLAPDRCCDKLVIDESDKAELAVMLRLL